MVGKRKDRWLRLELVYYSVMLLWREKCSGLQEIQLRMPLVCLVTVMIVLEYALRLLPLHLLCSPFVRDLLALCKKIGRVVSYPQSELAFSCVFLVYVTALRLLRFRSFAQFGRGINYVGTPITQWDFPDSPLFWKSHCVICVPGNIIYSVPCDQVMQRAY